MKTFSSGLSKNSVDRLFIISVGLLAILSNFPFTILGFFAFGYDQGRDLLEVAKIIYEKNITLIGPTTGQPGIFYGPWWYYFLSPLLFFAKGNPQTVANVFALIGVITAVAIYILIKTLTKNPLLAFSSSLIYVFSPFWMLHPTQIWSPSLTPFLMLTYIFNVERIFSKPKPINFFLLGLLTLLIADTGAAFGSVLALFLFPLLLIFRKEFFRKDFFLTIIGAFLVLLPRIVFDLRNNFLITKNVLYLFIHPKFYSVEDSLVTRFLQRLDHFWGLFAMTFTKGNKTHGALLIVVLALLVFALVRNQKMSKKLRGDNLLVFLAVLTIYLIVAFTYYKDTVWDYYLVGVPAIFVILVSKILNLSYKMKTLRIFATLVLAALIILNFNVKIFPPYKITWEGDDTAYRNPKMVMDYITGKNPHNYSYFAYSPALFDYPFDYLFYWYSKLNLIERPKKDQTLMYLIIREESSNRYKLTGWYGDKTRDNTTVIERKSFSGDLVLEVHQKNE